MVQRRGKLFSTVSFLLLASSISFADDGVSFRIHHQYESMRALGMGDAFVAVANDYSAIFYNPAGLARRTDGQINLSFDAGATPKFKNTYDDINAAQKVEGDAAKTSAIIDVINKNAGNTYQTRIVAPNAIWVRPNWGLAFIPADVSLQMDLHNQVGPTVNVTAYADTTLAYAYARDFDWFSDSRFSMGVTAKFVNRGFVSKPLSSVDLAADSSKIIDKTDLKEGYTVDGDIGALWTPNIPTEGLMSWFALAKPTFGVVVRNVAETGFGKSLKLLNKDSIGTPEKLYRVVDVGSRWEYPSAWIFGGRGTLDIRDIGHPLFSWRKAVHAGLEFDWTVTSWWKGHYNVGISESFWTAGIGAQLGWFNLDLVSYAEDVGPYNYPKESRMYMARFNLDF